MEIGLAASDCFGKEVWFGEYLMENQGITVINPAARYEFNDIRPES
jgi:hypothetical protein